MIIFQEAKTLQDFLQQRREKGHTIGFIPTMGALHEGHLALVKRSLAAGDFTVASIFVNPTQFNDPADYEKYPVTVDQDIRLLEETGCDLLFLPTLSEIYPDGLKPAQSYELGTLENVWEGVYRPGHFQGVCQVVERLLKLVMPHHLYMGLKDYQQCMVVQKLLELRFDGQPIELVPCPTLREPDGLAMSSRNRRLTPAARALAPELYKCLRDLEQSVKPGDLQPLLKHYREQLVIKGFRLDYLAAADARDLTEVLEWNGQQPIVLLLAAFCEDVRLIDNLVIKIKR